MSVRREDPVWAAFELEALIEQRRVSGELWLEFLDATTLRAGLYVLPEGGDDPQEPHEHDELYYVIQGRAVLEVEGKHTDVGPGMVIYVRAHAGHRFHHIREELHVLVLFSKAHGG